MMYLVGRTKRYALLALIFSVVLTTIFLFTRSNSFVHDYVSSERRRAEWSQQNPLNRGELSDQFAAGHRVQLAGDREKEDPSLPARVYRLVKARATLPPARLDQTRQFQPILPKSPIREQFRQVLQPPTRPEHAPASLNQVNSGKGQPGSLEIGQQRSIGTDQQMELDTSQQRSGEFNQQKSINPDPSLDQVNVRQSRKGQAESREIGQPRSMNTGQQRPLNIDQQKSLNIGQQRSMGKGDTVDQGGRRFPVPGQQLDQRTSGQVNSLQPAQYLRPNHVASPINATGSKTDNNVIGSHVYEPPSFHVLNQDHEEIASATVCNWVTFWPFVVSRTARMCAYPKEDDVWISGLLESTGRWEPGLMQAMEDLFAKDPKLNLIDIGANIGVFSILAALWGRQVLAVEANPNNAYKLITTVSRNNLTDAVLVLQNAVSDQRTKLELVVDKDNRGGSIVISDRASSSSRKGIPYTNRLYVSNVHAVLMDDLVSLIKFKRALLKIDVEGYEAIAFRKSWKLLKTLEICYIFMEWNWLRKEKNGGDVFVYKLLKGLGYTPYLEPSFSGSQIVDIAAYTVENIFWKKDNC